MIKSEAKQRIVGLRKLIDYHRYLYHVLDKQEISDDALDSLKKELFDLEQQYPDLITSDSPTQRVAGKPMENFKKVAHPGRMISLNDAFSRQDIEDWLNRLGNYLGRPYTGGFYCDIKMDGLAVELTYEAGVLVRASTRGDGVIGEDVTHNVRTVDAVPLRLRDKDERIPEALIVRGELYLTKTEFKRINKELQNKNEKTYANPRNLAAGTIRQLDPAVAAGRKLSFYAWSVVGPDGEYGAGFETHDAEFKALRAWGVSVNPYGRVAKDLDAVFAFYEEWNKKRDKLDYEFDGTVIATNDNAMYRRAGVVGKSPRGAVAFKFSARQAQTIVKNISIQVGRTGVLTPVAELKPVSIGGTTVSRATLHNLDEIERLGVKIGDTVIVGRAGDVIPDILKVLPELRNGKEKKFKMPTKCPVCGVNVSQDDGQVAYRCSNDDCPAKKRKTLYHFISRGALNMDGIGPETIDQLLDAGLIADAADLYTITRQDLLNLERFAEVSTQNFLDTVSSHTKVSLSKFIYALGIDNVGEQTGRTLAGHFHTLERVRHASLEDLQQVSDIGPVVARSINQWFLRPYNQKLLDKFSKAGLEITPEKATVGKLSGKSFVLTGALDTMSREEAAEKIRALGGKISSAVSKETDYVVAGDKAGSKYDKAQKLGVKILAEDEFIAILR